MNEVALREHAKRDGGYRTLRRYQPPAGNPNFLSFATLEKRPSLKSPTNHRSSFDGPLGLFCVASQCSRHVKLLRGLSPGVAPKLALRLLGNANTYRDDIQATGRSNAFACVHTPKRLAPSGQKMTTACPRSAKRARLPFERRGK